VKYEALFQVANLTDRALGHLLDALTEINCEFLENNPDFPYLYGSGVAYSHDGNDDPWMDAPTALAAGAGDCEDFACWRAAELRVRFGIDANACWLRKSEGGDQLIHVFVSLPGGRTEDPSRLLGMK
jgi:hypothetical protein